MLPEERRHRILGVIEHQGYARLGELAQAMGTSIDTVRRDIDSLDAGGFVDRTRGGAVARGAQPGIRPLAARIGTASPGKRRIAQAAAALISDGTSIVINGGSTTLAFVEALDAVRLSIVTNSLQIPSAVSADAVAQMHVLGGRVHPDVGATVGSGMFRGDASIAADVAVLGVGALSATRGLSMADPDEAELTRGMMRAAAKTIVLCDAGKFGREALAVVAPLADVDLVVVDEPPPTALVAALADAGVEVLVAG